MTFSRKNKKTKIPKLPHASFLISVLRVKLCQDFEPFEVCLFQRHIHIRFDLIIINSDLFRSMVNGLAIGKHVKFKVTPSYLNTYHAMDKVRRRQTDDIYLIILRKQDLTFQTNCLQWRQFA